MNQIFLARAFALSTITKQKEEFVSWGVLSDWSSPSGIYRTLDPDYIEVEHVEIS